jgi:ATP-dependent DNA ligase
VCRTLSGYLAHNLVGAGDSGDCENNRITAETVPTFGRRETFALLAECLRLGLEGIGCKRKGAPYRSGARSGWIKVKTEQWKAANQYRAKLF